MATTIAALSTAPQTAGIHVIRISGDDSVKILKKVFRPASNIEYFEHARMYYGHVMDNGVALDEGYAVSFYNPKSYTGEDVVEIQCHGSSVMSARILKLILENGAQPAQPGEFTKRAFLNGKMDLIQAESVMDLLSATGAAASKNAFEQLSGTLSASINKLKEHYVFVLANIDVDIDFPEADVEVVDRDMLMLRLAEARQITLDMLSSVDEGRVIKEGIKVAICGLPNAGKSSLLNTLIGSDRAIVTEIPGTTRDIIEESIIVNGVRVRLFDTAGIRDTEDKVETIGIDRTRKLIKESDVALVMLDGTIDTLGDDNKLLLDVTSGQKRIIAVNTSDIAKELPILDQIKDINGDIQIISAQTGEGIAQLKEKIYDLAMSSHGAEAVCLTNARQIDCLKRSLTALDNALSDMLMAPLDIAGISIREAYECILELVGEAIDDSVINEIFMSFCLGK